MESLFLELQIVLASNLKVYQGDQFCHNACMAFLW